MEYPDRGIPDAAGSGFGLGFGLGFHGAKLYIALDGFRVDPPDRFP